MNIDNLVTFLESELEAREISHDDGAYVHEARLALETAQSIRDSFRLLIRYAEGCPVAPAFLDKLCANLEKARKLAGVE